MLLVRLLRFLNLKQYGVEVKDHVLGGNGLYREVCPEGVQNKCPGGMV